jgi:hypothetical protein
MTNKFLNRLRNRSTNLTKEYSESLLISQKSAQRYDSVLPFEKVLDPDNFLNLVNLLLRFSSLADNLVLFKKLIRNLYFESYYFFSSINCQVLSIKLPICYTYK